MLPSAVLAGATVSIKATVTRRGDVLRHRDVHARGRSRSTRRRSSMAARRCPVTPAAVGASSLSAGYAGSGDYAASVSQVETLQVTAPFVLAATPSALTVAAGQSGEGAAQSPPASGFSGTVALTCASPVGYVSCTVEQPSWAISPALARRAPRPPSPRSRRPLHSCASRAAPRPTSPVSLSAHLRSGR